MERGNTKILIVDDDDTLRSLLAAILRNEGYSLFTAKDGAEALAVFSAEKPQVVITDVYMPKMDGVTLLKKIKQASPKTHVAIMTGQGTEELAAEALRNGASNYFKKPINTFEFLHAVNLLTQLVLKDRERVFDRKRIRSETMEVVLSNDLDAIYPLIDCITETPAAHVPDIDSVRIGLLEMIINAIEHGNLGITFPEKQDALRKQGLRDLYSQRASLPENSGKKVTIYYAFSPSRVSYMICDEGRGFDWRAFPDPGDASHMMDANGRGISVTRLFMDEVIYNDKGNEVTIIRYLKRTAV